jgi:superfamily II DNA or RNA helicase
VDSAIKDKLIQRIERHRKDNIDTVVKRIKKHEHINKMRIVAAKKPAASQASETPSVVSKASRELRDYQVSAINHWVDRGYTSIFEMATGTGKTFTAINALKKFKENKSYLRAVVVVPLTTLTVQWQEDIKKVLPDINIINTSVNAKWKDGLNNIIFSKDLGRDLDYVLVTTYSMFSKEDFGERIGRLGDDLILLADEMHNLVNTNRLKALANPVYKYKLGLSATPTRLWQPTESSIAKLHFGDNSYQYSLADAIKNEFLVPYNYHPIPTHLTTEEYDEYLDLSKEIARMSQVKTGENDGSSALHMKLIARSRIKKNAESKIFSLEKTLRDIQNSGGLQNALIYVDNEDYLQGLQEMLTRNNIRTTKFVGINSLEERLSAIQNLRTQSINAIVAIKCLDEGVDIPSAQTAFFIANNTDPREYVQRLGRVLRLDEEGGKKRSEIYDYIVMPPQDVVYENEMDRRIARNMIKNELIRARFFNELALNSSSAKELIDDAVDRYGFYYEDDELTYSIGDEDNELTY